MKPQLTMLIIAALQFLAGCETLTHKPAPTMLEALSPYDYELPANRVTLAALERNFGDLPKTQLPFRTFLDIFQRRTGLTLDVDWKEIEFSMDTDKAVISLDLRNATNRQALSAALRDACAGHAVPLDFCLDNGAIFISSDNRIRRTRLYVHVYDIADILAVTTPEKLIETIHLVAQYDSNFGGIHDDPRQSYHFFGTRLLIYDSPPFHAKVISILHQLRHPQKQSFVVHALHKIASNISCGLKGRY